MQARTIVLDANILIRAILGIRVRQLILDHAMATRFFAPDVAYADARTYLPALLQRRGMPEGPLMEVLDRLEAVVRPLTAEIYAPYRDRALERIATRDANDWPILACAMPWTAQYGPKMPISLVLASQPGPAIGSQFTCPDALFLS